MSFALRPVAIRGLQVVCGKVFHLPKQLGTNGEVGLGGHCFKPNPFDPLGVHYISLDSLVSVCVRAHACYIPKQSGSLLTVTHVRQTGGPEGWKAGCTDMMCTLKMQHLNISPHGTPYRHTIPLLSLAPPRRCGDHGGGQRHRAKAADLQHRGRLHVGAHGTGTETLQPGKLAAPGGGTGWFGIGCLVCWLIQGLVG